jgi:hypothetical protein
MNYPDHYSFPSWPTGPATRPLLQRRCQNALEAFLIRGLEIVPSADNNPRQGAQVFTRGDETYCVGADGSPIGPPPAPKGWAWEFVGDSKAPDRGWLILKLRKLGVCSNCGGPADLPHHTNCLTCNGGFP